MASLPEVLVVRYMCLSIRSRRDYWKTSLIFNVGPDWFAVVGPFGNNEASVYQAPDGIHSAFPVMLVPVN